VKNDVIPIDTRTAARLARELYDEVRGVLDDDHRKEPIARIEVCRLLGKVMVHCVPVRIVRGRRRGNAD